MQEGGANLEELLALSDLREEFVLGPAHVRDLSLEGLTLLLGFLSLELRCAQAGI